MPRVEEGCVLRPAGHLDHPADEDAVGTLVKLPVQGSLHGCERPKKDRRADAAPFPSAQLELRVRIVELLREEVGERRVLCRKIVDGEGAGLTYQPMRMRAANDTDQH